MPNLTKYNFQLFDLTFLDIKFKINLGDNMKTKDNKFKNIIYFIIIAIIILIIVIIYNNEFAKNNSYAIETRSR